MRADQYRRAADDLSAFLQAFDRLVGELQPVGYGHFLSWQPKPGHEAQASRLTAEVASLAGAAAEAFVVSGQHIEYKPPGTMQTQPVNPALVWSTMFDTLPMLDPPLMAVVGGQALGYLNHRHREQAARQKGLIGAPAWFFTLAPRVREAAGLPRHSGRGRFVAGLTVLLQTLFVTVVGGVLVLPLASWLGWGP